MGSNTNHQLLREQIRRVWIQYRAPVQDHIISIFKCKYFDQVDIEDDSLEQPEWKNRTRISNFFTPPKIDGDNGEAIEVIFPDEDFQQKLGDESRDTPLDCFRRSLYQCTRHDSAHGDSCSLEDFDHVFSRLTTIRFSSPASAEEEEVVLDHALGLILRLPPIPSELPDPPRLLGATLPWEDLKVVSTHSLHVICIALAVAIAWDCSLDLDRNTEEQHEFRKFLDSLAELLDTVIQEAKAAAQAKNECDIRRWFVLESYLWSTWQRCTTLHYWRILQIHLVLGFDFHDMMELSLRPLSISNPVPEQQDLLKSDYMCPLAYDILRRGRCANLMDLRDFHARFCDLFGGRDARCKNGKPCNANSLDCLRIRGAKIVDQSQHDVNCPNPEHCDRNRMVWDEDSYRDISGARAVSIAASDSSTPNIRLKYCQASSKTAAISHVWSHGQGGRPETGINACLHRRYCEIAKQHDCDSYWIDTACIPAEHKLRQEAIMTINDVFRHSGIVIVCDQDIMNIDVSSIVNETKSLSRESIRLRESILATLLVCDWNVRAWTLLEAHRGRRQIYLLCRAGQSNALISLKETLEIVSFHGSISIAVLLLTQYHLLPCPDAETWLVRNTDFQRPLPEAEMKLRIHRSSFLYRHGARTLSEKVEEGFVTTTEAALMLGHRFASRTGDDLVIWSLLVGEGNPLSDVPTLWESEAVYTGFLICSLPRLALPGLSWAPSQPMLQLKENTKFHGFPAYDSTLSRIGYVVWKDKKSSFLAEWGVSVIKDCDGSVGTVECDNYASSHFDSNSSYFAAADGYLKCYRKGILLQALREVELNDDQELSVGEGSHFNKHKAIASLYRGPSKGPLFAVCGTNEELDGPWSWLGIIEWRSDEKRPRFYAKEIVLV
ncbi:hypothetical protein F5B19DRAFT_391243 [Rostrohypoxylon terebratum]|nr:hypothetical protein F5B19DRAFT_391243 [Rostrohypoxylon terebratum]